MTQIYTDDAKELAHEMGFWFQDYETFTIRWRDEMKKLHFYQRVLSEQEFYLFDLLRRCSISPNVHALEPALGTDYKPSVAYREEIMTVLEWYDSALFNKYRLLDVTETLLTKNLFGEEAFPEEVVRNVAVFMRRKSQHLADTILHHTKTTLRKEFLARYQKKAQ